MDELDKQIQQVATKVYQSNLPEDTKRSIFLHLTKPWIPGFRAIALAPAHGMEGMEKWFGMKLFRTKGKDWYFPSTFWFVTHAKASHPPKGAGCSPAIHTSFLSKAGNNYEFDYTTLMKDGTANLLGPADFVYECRWWSKNF